MSRSSATIAIQRSGWESPVASVPITREATRKWKLMEMDCITLDFFWDEPIHFAVGDYVDDEEFGMFYITEEPKPAEYNPSNGAYRHQLQFDREYIGWKNKGFQMTLNNNGTLTRHYPVWSLTDKMQSFVEEFVRNLYLLGYTNYSITGKPSYAYCINGQDLYVYQSSTNTFVKFLGAAGLPAAERFTGATERENTANISFDGADLFSSLKAITDAYHCEWWVKEIKLTNIYYSGYFPILCFGKCEYGDYENFKLKPGAGDYVDFWDKDEKDFWDKDEKDFVTADVLPGGGINMESVALNRSEQKFANRLYVFGGTTNIPSSYRKKVSFVASGNQSDGWRDANGHDVTLDMFHYTPFPELSTGVTGFTSSPDLNEMWLDGDIMTLNAGSNNARYRYAGTNMAYKLAFKFSSSVSEYTITAKIARYIGGSGVYILNDNIPTSFVPTGVDASGYITVEGSFNAPSSPGYFDYYGGSLSFRPLIILSVNVIIPSGPTVEFKNSTTAQKLTSGTYKLVPEAIAIETVLICGGTEYNITFNEDFTTDDFSHFFFDAGEPMPSSFAGKEYSIVTYPEYESGLIETLVPANFFVDIYGDPNSIRTIGERRLMLPISAGPYIGDSELSRDAVVEQVVMFNDIFPKCALRVYDINTRNEVERIEYEDGTINEFTVLKYYFKLKRITPLGDVDFPFDEKYLTDVDLQVKFITADEEKSYTDGQAYGTSYKLTGMTFSVVWNQTDKTYTVNWNEDYGAQLPNTTLFPDNGDPLLLLGWNVAAMSRIDPDSNIIGDAEAALLVAGQQYLAELNNAQFTFDCSMMSDWAYGKGVLQFGQKARVWHEGLALGYRESRVIAYELHLDYPYNTPKYTVGETEAYSRLKALERELNEETRGASAGAVINATGYGGGGGGGAMDWYNIKPSKHPTSGKLSAIIENYSENLEDDTKYRMVLLRWRKSRRKPYYFNSWHAPMFGSNNAEFNEIPAQDRYWAIESNEQVLFGTTGHEYTDVLPLLIKQREEDGTYQFKNTHNRKMYFGCAIYKNTGVGHWGWQRVSNIAVFELFITNSADILLSIKPQ